MNYEMIFMLDSEQDTFILGCILGFLLIPGDIVLLVGQMGVGKTVFSRGVARGVGIDENYIILSPFFTLLNVYPGRLYFYHADLYRLEASVEELGLLEESVNGILVVEWPEKVVNFWPVEALWIKLIYESKKDKARQIKIIGPQILLKKLANIYVNSSSYFILKTNKNKNKYILE